MHVRHKNEKMRKGFMFLVVLVGLLSCNKDTDHQSEGLDLTSAWKETEHYFSIGGPIEWYSTEAKDAELIEFKKDNVFTSSAHTNLNRYKIEPVDGNTSAKLKLYEAGKIDTLTWTIYNITQDSIDVAFSNCIEGCGKRFKRVR